MQNLDVILLTSVVCCGMLWYVVMQQEFSQPAPIPYINVTVATIVGVVENYVTVVLVWIKLGVTF